MSNYPAYICRIAALIQEIKDNLSPVSMAHALDYMHKESGKLLAPPKSRGILNDYEC